MSQSITHVNPQLEQLLSHLMRGIVAAFTGAEAKEKSQKSCS